MLRIDTITFNQAIMTRCFPSLLLLGILSFASMASEIFQTPELIDLSYQHHVDSSRIAKSLGKDVGSLCTVAKRRVENKQMVVDVDVSSSLLGDDGMGKVLDALLETEGREKDVKRVINLSARMNGITPVGATELFARLRTLAEMAKSAARDGCDQDNKDDTRIGENGDETSWTVPVEEEGGTKQRESYATGGVPDGDRSADIRQMNRAQPKTTDNGEKPEISTATGSEAATKSSSVPGDVESTIVKDGANGGSTVSEERAPGLYVQSLDIGFNVIGYGSGSRSLFGALRNLIESVDGACPREIRLDSCGLGPSACRAIGKGLINSGKLTARSNSFYSNKRLVSLHLSGNDDIGDAGVAALAAALRTAKRSQITAAAGGPSDNASNSNEVSCSPILENIDLSSCNIGDAGAEALAMAIEGNPGCVRRIDLSNNHITDDGVAALAKALVTNTAFGATKMASSNIPNAEVSCVVESIDLSNNKEIGDRGASAIAEAVKCGILRSVFLRSCSVRADGAMAFGQAVKALVMEGRPVQDQAVTHIDLSGNQLGVLQQKKKGGGAKYSASLIKSRASATTASYMNFIGQKIRSGLKDAGLDVGFGASAESDDEEDDILATTREQGDDQFDASKARCGAKSFSEPIINSAIDSKSTAITNDDQAQGNPNRARCILGMRQCSLDQGAADALAASIIQARSDAAGVELIVDATMNAEIGDSSVLALGGEKSEEMRLQNMATRHLDALEALRIARQRAAEAAEAAAARARAEAAVNAAWGAGGEYSDDYGSDYDRDAYGNDEYDSDADYN